MWLFKKLFGKSNVEESRNTEASGIDAIPNTDLAGSSCSSQSPPIEQVTMVCNETSVSDSNLSIRGSVVCDDLPQRQLLPVEKTELKIEHVYNLRSRSKNSISESLNVNEEGLTSRVVNDEKTICGQKQSIHAQDLGKRKKDEFTQNGGGDTISRSVVINETKVEKKLNIAKRKRCSTDEAATAKRIRTEDEDGNDASNMDTRDAE
ncbi:uncharacterized protein LOC119663565 [Teleopsis dalmanni]|uniref:uncharacterized protein LOC119661809 n=1 Tax=Teleopsis dalmanni TaxID=139649 RepID=UPI000D32CCF1|nr:uncharacterized protein LOC119661809 [Teleopsis dalmanni]XP_037927239.1 uncharacterized protein LOC119661814 [Teleopsis dalmanni]XP_037927392.1 uncharacterized protein LOC119661946 [Teleopsis dalmanni]XP_037928789.1 uncharacterized protein LOC119663203 [Teleopsis dalmanni]XP_037928790.1 uncharacterized protein LOC119663204 [Teleopsis dalmanni]XP_037928791.1 uncharacterized protein LOC119663205 [Teleopsis dalmanni]XP_037929101.1 uncharacterized protein LOC119663564 [Teleopsis dalmanni]XP_0